MEALADCGSIDAELEAVSDEMEVTAGLIQKLVDENATRKLDQHDYRKKYDGYASRYAALESQLDSLEKERERKEIQYDIFSGFLAGLSETEELPVDFIQMAGWFLPSATEWKSARRFKESSSGQVPGTFGYPTRCFCVWKFADKPFSI